MSLSLAGSEYIVLFRFLAEESSAIILEQVTEKMNKLWYYHLTPADKKMINEQFGDHRKGY